MTDSFLLTDCLGTYSSDEIRGLSRGGVAFLSERVLREREVLRRFCAENPCRKEPKLTFPSVSSPFPACSIVSDY